jgi:hypothetical protein
MGTSNVDRLLSVLKRHEPLLEERLRDATPELVENEAMKFLKRLSRSDRAGRPGRPGRIEIETLAPQPAARKARLKAVVDSNPGFKAEISALELLDDDALWNAAQTKMPIPDSKRMEDLHRRQRLTGLSDSEAQELARLEHQYERVILVRSHSAWLLEQRGHDVHKLIRTPRPSPGR